MWEKKLSRLGKDEGGAWEVMKVPGKCWATARRHGGAWKVVAAAAATALVEQGKGKFKIFGF